MTKDDDILERTRETIKKAEKLIAEAEARIRETDALYQSLGIKRGKATEFLNRADIPPELRKKIEEERRRFQQEIEEEIKRAMREKKESGSSKLDLAMRKGFVRI